MFFFFFFFFPGTPTEKISRCKFGYRLHRKTRERQKTSGIEQVPTTRLRRPFIICRSVPMAIGRTRFVCEAENDHTGEGKTQSFLID